MISKILNVILCFLFIKWGLQFVKLPIDSNLLDIFFVSGIFILSLILFYEHHIKKPTLEFINWLYPELNLFNLNSNDKNDEDDNITPITTNDTTENENNVIENLDNDLNTLNTENIVENDITCEDNKTIEIELKEINI